SAGALSSFALVIGVWWLATVLAPVSSTILPTPLDTALAFREMAASGVLWKDLAASLSRAAIGFAIGAGLGVAAGLLTGRTRIFRL
ncbi:hypothetical protein ACSTJA_23350, partial [Vibrio parahaemolyticus]